MLKSMMVIGVVATVLSACAEEANSQNDSARKVLPVHPSKMAAFNAKTGGLVEPPKSAKTLVFLDARGTDVPQLSKFTQAAEQRLMAAIDIRKIELKSSEDPQTVAFNAKKTGAGAVVLLYYRDGDSTLNVFPEDAIVLVNLAPLRCEDPNRFSRRFATEFWRSVSFALGGYANTVQLGSSMQGIFSIADFDTLRGAGLGPNEVTAINVNKAKLGICGRMPVPYSRACREGWAPTPTNDVQRALYKKFQDPTSRFKTDFEK